jgi:hypothetical protein
MRDVRFRTLAAVVVVVAGATSCSEAESSVRGRLELLEQDPVAATEVAGTHVVGRRSDAGESFLGESGVEVKALFDVTGARHEVADAYVLLASRGGWRVSVRCQRDRTLVWGSKQFPGFVASADVVVGDESGSMTLTASDEVEETTTVQDAPDPPASCRPSLPITTTRLIGQDARMAEDLRRQMEAFERCVEERDTALAERLLDDDYALVLVHPQPAVMPRARWLEVLTDYVVHDFEVQEQVLDVEGELAVVLQRVRMSATVLGEDRSGVFVISDIWRRGDEWRIWRRHSTPLVAGAMPGTGLE